MSRARRYRIHLLTILAVLSFSTFIPALAYAAPLGTSAKDWVDVNGNSWAWNYSPQTQITKDNVANLEVKWIFPVGTKSLAPAAIQSMSLSEGANTPPIVKDGIVYFTTNFLKTYAIDAKTGKQIWVHDYTVDVEETQERLPILLTSYHLHSIRYWETGDMILNFGFACDIYGVDAKTGEDKLSIKDLCKDIPGNLYKYRRQYNSLATIGTYEKGRQFIYVQAGHMHSSIYAGDGRHVTLGIDMDTHQILWRVFSFPPHGVPSKDWALQECDIGFFQTYPCTEVAARNRAGLEWDWAFPGEPPSIYGGVTANWGTPVIDEDTGILYTQTGNQGPYTNLTLTPGPRLYGSTIMAIDLNKGQRVWWLQPFPHDPYDYDCNWSGILAEHPTLGKIYMKGCKEGRLYIMDAMTGKPHYVVDVVDEQIEWGQITTAAAKEMPEGVRYHLTDPFSYTDLREWNSVTDGTYCTAPCNVYPHWFNGVFATDKSYDPTTQTLYHYANTVYVQITAEHPYVEGSSVTSTKNMLPWNSTIVARDIATGNVKWTWFYGHSAQRSHLVVAGDIVFTGFTDGQVRFFDKATGALLYTLNVGTGMVTGPTTGQDSDGDQKIFLIAGGTSIVNAYAGPGFGNLGPLQPGTLIALGLSEVKTTTVTTTITTTSRTTLTTTTATTTTVTSTTTLATTSTVVSTAPPSTTTLTSQITETVGLPAEVTYAAVAIAVIAIIAAAILVTRRRP